MKRITTAALAVLLLSSAFAVTPTPQLAMAQANSPESDTPPVQLSASSGSLTVSFSLPSSVSANSAAANNSTQLAQQLAANGWKQIQFGDLRLPGQTVLVALDGSVDAQAAVVAARVADTAVTSTLYSAQIEQIEVPVPQTPDGELWPDLRREPVTTLPDSPLTVTSQGTLRGIRLAVLTLSPIYAENGETRLATQFSATLNGMRVVDDPISMLDAFDNADAIRGKLGVAPQSSDVTCGDSSYQPVNTWSGSSLNARIRVTRAGIQQITAAAMSSAGLTGVAWANIRISYRNQTVAIRRLDFNTNGVFDGSDALRFYARDPGDRWNAGDIYWLTVVSSGASPDMGIRGAPTGNPAAISTGLQRGTYVSEKIYDATMAGADGNHWFAADLKAANGAAATWSFTPPVILPSAGGSTVRVTVAGKTNTTHNVTLTSASGSANASVNGLGALTATFSLPGDFNGASSFALQPQGNNAPEVVLPDVVLWERTVALNFSSNGARFAVNAAAGTYATVNPTTPSQGNDALYDVTDPLNPQLVLMDGNNKFTHTGGDHTYVMSGSGSLFTSGDANGPTLAKYTPFGMDAALNLNVIYISPATFAAAAGKLADQRGAQGYTSGNIAVDMIYDWWSFGQVSPTAIRNFLRYAYCTWSTKPIAVTFFGDGSVDPFDRMGYNTDPTKPTNVTIIPPYMAPVDPFLTTSLGAAETACDACFAQLDGADPLSDKLADIYFGRLVAKNATEAMALANKIIGYETAQTLTTGALDWRNKLAYVVDNYYLTNDPNGATDSAGNFAAAADQSIAAQDRARQIVRMYYDPTASAGHPYRISNPATANSTTKSIFNAGAGVVTYIGHGNIAQMAVTEWPATADTNVNPGNLLALLDPDNLTNAGKLPIVVQLTCLSSAFQTPVIYYGTTIDERLVLANNGAVAVWGPTSLGVGYSHDALAHGFFQTLKAGPMYQVTVGKATAGGYAELFAQGSGSSAIYNLLYTFVILGDPLTPARVGINRQLTPIVTRNTIKR